MGCGWWELKAGERWEDGGQGRKAWELGTRSEEFLRIWMASFGVRQGFDARATGSEWIQGSEEDGNFFAWYGRGVVERDGCGGGRRWFLGVVLLLLVLLCWCSLLVLNPTALLALLCSNCCLPCLLHTALGLFSLWHLCRALLLPLCVHSVVAIDPSFSLIYPTQPQ